LRALDLTIQFSRGNMGSTAKANMNTKVYIYMTKTINPPNNIIKEY